MKLLDIAPAFFAVAALAGSPGQEADPGPQKVLEKSLTALGGISSLEGIKSRYVSGTVEVLGGFSGTYQVWAKAPNKIKTKWDIGYIQQERGFDGTQGWEKNVAVRQLAGRDFERLKRSAVFAPLLSYWKDGVPAELEAMGEVDGRKTYVVRFRPPDAPQELFYFDVQSFLLLREVRQDPYEEGILSVTITYSNYRKVGELALPFSIVEARPDLPLSITIEEYRLDQPIEDATFTNPLATHFSEPVEVTLATSPARVYKEADGARNDAWARFWGIPFGPTESLTFDLIVREKHGRYLEPSSARITFYSGSNLVQSIELSRDPLSSLRAFPAARFFPPEEIYHFRHYFSEPSTLHVDRLSYRLELEDPAGRRFQANLDIPVSYYQQKTKLIFPIKGKFVVTGGHEFYELSHKYERSQHYAYDIVGLNEDYALATHDGRTSEDFFAFGTREILAPADGVIVYARNDVPDTRVPRSYLKMRDALFAIAGNVVIMDHGTGEYSLFAHMKEGSVRVKRGDRVKQGEVIGLMGSAGSPGHPHLHYQLQAGAGVFDSDGLPSRFENVGRGGWLESGQKVLTPRRGIYLVAK